MTSTNRKKALLHSRGYVETAASVEALTTRNGATETHLIDEASLLLHSRQCSNSFLSLTHTRTHSHCYIRKRERKCRFLIRRRSSKRWMEEGRKEREHKRSEVVSQSFSHQAISFLELSVGRSVGRPPLENNGLIPKSGN